MPTTAVPHARAIAWLGPAVRYVRRHPVAADSVLAAGLVALSLWLRHDGWIEAPEEPTWSMLLTLVALCSISLRRRWPLLVWITVSVASVADTEYGVGDSALSFALFISLYSVASVTSTVVAVGTFAVSLGVQAIALWISGYLADFAGIASLSAWLALATAAGLAVRNQGRLSRAAQERARLVEESHEEEAQRRVDEERLRIARELHDVLAHHIAVISVQARVADELLATDPAAVRQAIGVVEDASAEVLSEMSTIVGLLRTPGEDRSLHPARGLRDLDALVESFRGAGLVIAFTESGIRRSASPFVDVTAYRVAEEALTNASRHGSGFRADVLVEWTDAAVTVEVRNPVRPSSPSDGDRGHGLVGMRERVAAVGGTLRTGVDGSYVYVVRAELPLVPRRGDGYGP